MQSRPSWASERIPVVNRIEEAAWHALGEVMDPELGEAITELGFVDKWQVRNGIALVHLRLPTFFCAPNFAWLMVSDARDALLSVPGIAGAEVYLDDYFAGDEINTAIAASSGFEDCFVGEVSGDLIELRTTFRAKAYVAALERVCRQLRRAGTPLSDLGALRLGDLPPGADTDRLVRRRRDLEITVVPDSALLLDASGTCIPPPELAAWLRRAQTVRVNMESNGEMCRGLLHSSRVLAEMAGDGGRPG
jgi:metal-sulfur cluster biosynthetic enzyme